MVEKDVCQHCGQQLQTPEFTDYKFCRSSSCQREKVKQILRHKTQLNEALLERAQIMVGELAAASTSVEEGEAFIGLVPANTDELGKTSAEKVKKFKQHLVELFSKYSDGRNFPYSADNYRHIDNLVAPKWLDSACTSCKGYCCRLGQHHGFLDWQSITDIRAKLDKFYNDDELISYYQAYIPAESFEHGCVFQGKRGCALPKHLRSHTCNRYLCSEIKNISSELTSQKPQRKALYFASISEGEIVQLKKSTCN